MDLSQSIVNSFMSSLEHTTRDPPLLLQTQSKLKVINGSSFMVLDEVQDCGIMLLKLAKFFLRKELIVGENISSKQAW